MFSQNVIYCYTVQYWVTASGSQNNALKLFAKKLYTSCQWLCSGETSISETSGLTKLLFWLYEI